MHVMFHMQQFKPCCTLAVAVRLYYYP